MPGIEETGRGSSLITPTRYHSTPMDLVYVRQVMKFCDVVGFLVNSMGIAFNLLVVLLVLVKTPETMKSYAVLLFSLALSDSVNSLCQLMSIQQTIFSGESTTVIFRGLCKKLTPTLCYYYHAATCAFIPHSLLIVMMSFCYRFAILGSFQPTVKIVAILNLVLCVPTLVNGVVYGSDKGQDEYLRERLYSYHPEYGFNDTEFWGEFIVQGNDSTYSWRTIFTTIFVCCGSIPIYVTIIIMRYKTLKKLDDESSNINLSQTVIKCHRQLVKALTAQAMIPGIWTLAISFYLCDQFDIINNVWTQNFSFRVVEIVPMLSPLMSLFFVIPYKNAILDFLHWKRAKTDVLSATNSLWV